MISRREILRALSVTAGAFAVPGLGGCGAQLVRAAAPAARPAKEVRAQLVDVVDALSRRYGEVSALSTVRRAHLSQVDTAGPTLATHTEAGVVIAFRDGRARREVATFDTSAGGIAALAKKLGGTRSPGKGARATSKAFALPPDARVPAEPKTWLELADKLAARAASAGKSRIIYWRARLAAVDTESVYVDARKRLSQRVVRAAADVSLVAWTGRVPAAQSATAGTTAGLEAATLSQDALERAADRVLSLVYARQAPAGKRAVVLSPEVAAAFLHGAVAPLLVADFLAAGGGPHLRPGDKLGSKLVTIVDDATRAGGFGSHAFDDAGRPAKKITLIDQGVVTGLLATTSSPGAKVTAHARRPSPTSPLVPAPSNLVWKAGKTSPGDLVAGIDDGLLLEGPAGAWLDPKTRRVTLRASLGHRLLHGHKSGHLYRDITLTGKLDDILASVTAVATAAPHAAWLAGDDATPPSAAIAPQVALRMEVL